jgi:hypothetical protein
VLLTDKRSLAVLVLGFCLLLSVSQFVSTLSIHATKTIGISKTALGFLYTLNGAVIICFLMPINTLIKKINIFMRIAVGAVLYTLAFVGFGASTTWSHLAASMVLMTTGEILSLTAILTAISRMAPANMVGRYMGLYGLVEGVGWAMGPYLGALLFERFQSQPLLLWTLLGGFATLAGGGFLVLAAMDGEV